MTVENFYKRFLKENGLYFYGLKMSKRFLINNRKLGFENVLPKKLSYMLCVATREGLPSLFRLQFQYEGMFSGDSRSVKRRRYYRFNKKWKDSIRGKVVIQHNVIPGDILNFTSFYGYKRKYLVKRISKTDLSRVIVSPLLEKGKIAPYEDVMNILCFDDIVDSNKDLVINLYIKNTDGTCYGKIDGNFAEIQL